MTEQEILDAVENYAKRGGIDTPGVVWTEPISEDTYSGYTTRKQNIIWFSKNMIDAPESEANTISFIVAHEVGHRIDLTKNRLRTMIMCVLLYIPFLIMLMTGNIAIQLLGMVLGIILVPRITLLTDEYMADRFASKITRIGFDDPVGRYIRVFFLQ